MDTILEQNTMSKIIEIAKISVGDKLINLGEVLETAEFEDCYSLVISRRNQRQVWTFDKDDVLMVQ